MWRQQAAYAETLGWQNVIVIDDDLGRSGGGVSRKDFERLLVAVGPSPWVGVSLGGALQLADSQLRLGWDAAELHEGVDRWNDDEAKKG
jgi:hypothetical protein